MKIQSNMKKIYLRNYNEAKGVAVNKKTVLKKKTNKVPNYFISVILTIILLTIFTIIFKIIDTSKIFSIYFSSSLIIYILYTITRTIWSYNFKKKNNFENIIILDEEGLTDKSFYDIKITITWDKIKAFVVKKHTITVITDTSLYFFFDIKDKEQVLTAIKKYNQDTLIIE